MGSRWKNTYYTSRTYKGRDTFIAVMMFVAALFGVLSAGDYEFPLLLAVPYVFLVGSTPWLAYNILAFIRGWEKSHLWDLCVYWFDMIINTFPW